MVLVVQQLNIVLTPILDPTKLHMHSRKFVNSACLLDTLGAWNLPGLCKISPQRCDFIDHFSFQ